MNALTFVLNLNCFSAGEDKEVCKYILHLGLTLNDATVHIFV